MASVNPTIATTITTANTTMASWDTLHTTYVNKSQTRIFVLRDHLTCLKKYSQSVTKYLQHILSISDKNSTAGAQITFSKLIVKILSGLLLSTHTNLLFFMNKSMKSYWIMIFSFAMKSQSTLLTILLL